MESRRIHLWNNCNGCGASPIVGRRYECQTCPIGPDGDFCAACYEKIQTGGLLHPSPDNPMTAHLAGKTHHFRAYEGSPEEDVRVWSQVPWVERGAPQVADGFVVRPEFCAGYESTFAGYSFVVNHPDGSGPILLTAFHVMDEMLRKKGVDASPDNKAYSGSELPAHITGVNLYNVFAANWMIESLGRADRMLVLPRARIKEPEPLGDNDIAAFRIGNPAGLRPANLATQTPPVGSPIWLAASFGRGHQQRTFAAVVVAVNERSFIYRLKEKVPPYTSGAPLLNADGDVVALNVGGGDWENHRFGHGNGATSIRAHLA